MEIERWVYGFLGNECVCHVHYPVDEKYSQRQRQVPQTERDPVQAVVNRQNQDRRYVVDESPYVVGFHNREEYSPEEKCDNNLECQACLIKEDAPLPQDPG